MDKNYICDQYYEKTLPAIYIASIEARRAGEHGVLLMGFESSKKHGRGFAPSKNELSKSDGNGKYKIN